MDTLEMTTTTPPVFRALRLLGLRTATAATLAGIPEDEAERYTAGTERLPARHGLFLALFAAAWLDIMERSLRPLPGRTQQAERHLVAARQLIQAQGRLNESTALERDYISATARWRAFLEQTPAIWDAIVATVRNAPPSREHINVMIANHEYLH